MSNTTIELMQLLEDFVLDEHMTWTPLPGPPDHPEASAFQAEHGPWRVIIIGAPADTQGNTPIGGAATHMERGMVIHLPLELAHKGWLMAKEQHR